ncbi:MAG: hypothetical protein P1U74_08965 [Legionellaceae bacterium]|nr:hypothetical protein [Legionellaceae bacterium]
MELRQETKDTVDTVVMTEISSRKFKSKAAPKTNALDDTMDSTPVTTKGDSSAFKLKAISIAIKVSMAILMAAAALVLVALLVNPAILPGILPGVVTGLSPLAFNAIFGSAIAVGAAATIGLVAESTMSKNAYPSNAGLFACFNKKADDDDTVSVEHDDTRTVPFGLGSASEV